MLFQIYACTGCWRVSVTHALFLFFQPHLLWFLSQEHFHGLWCPGGSLEGACCGGPCSQTSRGKPWRELSRNRNISANQTGRNLPVNWDLKIPRYSYKKKKKVYQKKKYNYLDKLLTDTVLKMYRHSVLLNAALNHDSSFKGIRCIDFLCSV